MPIILINALFSKDPKGLVTYKSEVTLSTCIHSACCGIYLEINSTYLVNSEYNLCEMN